MRAHLAEVVERADRDDVPTVMTRRGREVAAVVSVEVLRTYQEWEEREINRIIDERTAKPAPGVVFAILLKDGAESASAPKLPTPPIPSGDDLKPFLGHWSPYGPRCY